jgi:uncharacterized membrane protein
MPDGNIAGEVEEIIKDLPESHRRVVKAVIAGVSIQRSSWQGPLPPPEILKDYNEAVPNGAERILKMVEVQSGCRQDLDRMATLTQLAESKRGQIFAFIIAMSFLIASFILILKGHEIFGTIIGSIDLVALVSVFIYGKYTQRRIL